MQADGPQTDARELGRVLITGATGMVGSAVLRALLRSDSVNGVLSLGRRSTGVAHPKLREVPFAEFGQASAIKPHLEGIDTVFHCLATYSSRVSRADYRELTVDWLKALVTACDAAAPKVGFYLFSAQGARPDGGGMSYALRVKGEAEQVLMASNLPRKFAFRPGYIAPALPRRGWKLPDHLFVPLQRVMPGIGVTADELAQAMVLTAAHDGRAEAILENGEMRQILE